MMTKMKLIVPILIVLTVLIGLSDQQMNRMSRRMSQSNKPIVIVLNRSRKAGNSRLYKGKSKGKKTTTTTMAPSEEEETDDSEESEE